MTTTSLTRGLCLSACITLLAVACFAAEQSFQTAAEEQSVSVPSHEVFACYFHRTVRCPTCKKISSYIDETVQNRFTSQVKDGSVKMIMVDFQDAKNQKATQAYKITGPTLIIMDLHNGDATSWKPAPKVWSLVGKKDDFSKYVQDEIQLYLDGKKTASR